MLGLYHFRNSAWWKRIQDRPSYQAELSGALGAVEVGEMQVTGARLKSRLTELRAEYLSQFG